MGSGIGGSKVGNGFAIQCIGCVVAVDGGHLIAVLTGRDGGLVDKGDLCRPERFEQVKVLDDLGVDDLMGNSRLVLFGVHPGAFDHAQADVDNVAVIHCKTGASRECGAGEEEQ